MKNKEIDREVLRSVALRSQELRKHSIKELTSLPGYTSEKIDIEGNSQELGIYHQKIENGESLIVVQCKNTLFLGIGKMYSKGFVISPSGEIRDAEEELMWEFT